MERSVLGIQNWLPEEIGQRLRVDTYEGRPDVYRSCAFRSRETRYPPGRSTDSSRVATAIVFRLREAASTPNSGSRGRQATGSFYYEGQVTGLCGTAPFSSTVGGAGDSTSSAATRSLGFDEESVSTFEVVMVATSCFTLLFEVRRGGELRAELRRNRTRGRRGERHDVCGGWTGNPAGARPSSTCGRDDYYGHGRPDRATMSAAAGSWSRRPGSSPARAPWRCAFPPGTGRSAANWSIRSRERGAPAAALQTGTARGTRAKSPGARLVFLREFLVRRFRYSFV